jgi:hypothetical protein
MLRNTIQHYLYWKQEINNQIIKTINLLRVCIWVCVPFAVVDFIIQHFFNGTELFLSFMFWAVVILLIFYWMPNKKEYKAWKKTHATF